MYTPDMLADSLVTIADHRQSDVPVKGGLLIWGCVHEDRATAHQMAIDSLSKTYAQDFSKLVGKYAFAGTPDDVTEQLGAFVDAGAGTIIVSFACPGSHIGTARRLFAENVLPALRS
jgi:alkanesulfonate monooxygenase SsuD/methylene tetrahydromethanopterin reductase-like flavin-dependent oxidoreductase (luciferase family)